MRQKKLPPQNVLNLIYYIKTKNAIATVFPVFAKKFDGDLSVFFSDIAKTAAGQFLKGVSAKNQRIRFSKNLNMLNRKSRRLPMVSISTLYTFTTRSSEVLAKVPT